MARGGDCLGDGRRSADLARGHRSGGSAGPHANGADGQQGGGAMTTALAQAMQTIPQGVDYVRILPELVLSIFGMIVMMVEPMIDERRNQRVLGTIALVGSMAAVAASVYQAGFPGFAFWNMVRVDGFSIFFHVLVTTIAAVVILASYEYMSVQKIRAGEYYGLILFGTVGMCLMSSAVE